MHRLKELSEGSKAPPAERTEAKLRQNCETLYKQRFEQAIGVAIHNAWITGEAGDLGIRISSKEVKKEFEADKQAFKDEAEFKGYIKKASESVAEVIAGVKLNMQTQAILARIKAKEHQPSAARVARYYASHRAQFKILPGRDVRIVRTATAAAAAKAKQELQSGTSFAEVAKNLSAIGQPLGAKNGEVTDLKPGIYEEKILNDAIFTAKPHRLYGPLQLAAVHKTIAPETNTGFFIFEVLKSTPGGQTPLSKVKAGLAASLAKAQKKKVFPPFILAYRKKWKSRTDCSPGYVVPYCKQYEGSKAQEEVDPYTL